MLIFLLKNRDYIVTESTEKPKPLTADDLKIKDMKDTVDRTKKIMVDNIDQLLQRGEKLEKLVDKSDQTQEQAQIFTQQARQIQIKARFENIALTAAMLGFVIGGFYGLSSGIGLPMVAICGGIGGVIFYSVVWMFSGAIQSILKLPFLNFGFSLSPEKISEEDFSLVKEFQPSINPISMNDAGMNDESFNYIKPYVIRTPNNALKHKMPVSEQAPHVEDKARYKFI